VARLCFCSASNRFCSFFSRRRCWAAVSRFGARGAAGASGGAAAADAAPAFDVDAGFDTELERAEGLLDILCDVGGCTFFQSCTVCGQKRGENITRYDTARAFQRNQKNVYLFKCRRVFEVKSMRRACASFKALSNRQGFFLIFLVFFWMMTLMSYLTML
jgi:hypothetical protein